MSKKEPVGPTSCYKDGECKIFEGDDVAKAEADGWKDSPYGPSDSTPEPTEQAPSTPEPTQEDDQTTAE